MGNYVGCCLPVNNNKGTRNPNAMDQDARFYISSIISRDTNASGKNCSFISRIFSSRSIDRMKGGFWTDPYHRLADPVEPSESGITLQNLDARALLQRAPRNSTPCSSLDLEWEHEGPSQMSNIGAKWEDQTTMTAYSNASNLSRQSSGTSLEWDPVNGTTASAADSSNLLCELDSDTLQLLNEIERLTKKALSETGKELDFS